MEKEREIINVLQEAEPSALFFLVTRVKLALLFYKIKGESYKVTTTHNPNTNSPFSLQTTATHPVNTELN